MATVSNVLPIAAVFSSLITSVSLTSLAFAREFIFGDAAATLTSPVRSSFIAAVIALGNVLTTGIGTLLHLDAFDDAEIMAIGPPTTASMNKKFTYYAHIIIGWN